MRKERKSKLMPVLMTLILLLSVIALVPQSILAAVTIDVSDTSDLTCGEEIWVNVSGLTPDVRYYVFVENETADWGDNVGDERADDDGEISLEINVPYRNPLGAYSLSLHNSSSPTIATHHGANETLNIDNTFDVRFKSGTEYLAYAVYNETYEYPNAFEFYVYNWTGSKYELYEDEITMTLYDPSGDLEYTKTTSTGIWDIDYTFDSVDDDPNFEVKYWLNVTDTADANKHSNATLPVKFDVTAELPSDVDWGDTITISGYVKDGNDDGVGGYTVKLYCPGATGYQEMDSAVTYSSGRYSLSAPTDDGSAGIWYIGTFDGTATYRIDTPDKFVASADGFIPYHSIDVASDDSPIVSVDSPDEIVSGFNQTLNITVKNSWDDDYYDEMTIHVTGLETTFMGNYYDDDDIIVVHDTGANWITENDKYAHYEFKIKFNETGTGEIIVTHPLNSSEYDDIDDLEANITGSTTFTVVSPSEMTIIVENMPDKVKIDEDANGAASTDCDWINVSTDVTFLIYGDDQDDRNNATIEITGCGVDIEIEEDEAVADGYWNSDGNYTVPISPEHAGTLTVTVSNDTNNLSYSKDYSIGGLSGSVTTSEGDDKEMSVESTETITVSIPVGGQYGEVHLTWFDEDWNTAVETCINDTIGDNTAGNGLNGEFNFVVTDEDIEDGVGYIVVAALAGSGMYLYDIIEVVPIHDMVIDIIDPVDAANQTLTCGLEHAWEFRILDGNGALITDIDEVKAEILDNDGDVIQDEQLKVKSGDIWYMDDWVPSFAGDLLITAVNNSGGNEHDGNITLEVGLAEITYSPDSVTAGIETENITVEVSGVDANGNPLADGTKLYLTLDDGTGTDTKPDIDDYITLDEDGLGEFDIEIVGDDEGKINATLQDPYSTSYKGNVTLGEVSINFPTFVLDPDTIFINMANTVTIYAYDNDNNPIEGINITLVPSSKGIMGSQPEPVETDSDGMVTLSITPEASGRLNVTIARDIKYVGGLLNWSNAVITDTIITVTALKSFEISVSKSPVFEGETLTVTIRSGGGALVSEVSIEFGQFTSQTDSNGEVEFTVPDPGVESAIYTITAKKTGYTTEEKTISVIKIFDITITVPSTITTGASFTITTIAKGSGLAGATVTFNDVTKTSDNDGKVTFTAPSEEGDYVISATYENYKTGEITITIGPGGIPGFELLTLIAAIGVAFILFRRRRN